MRPYYIHEANLVIPDGWSDQSINAFAIPSDDGRRHVSLVVSRDYESPSPDVADYADRQLIEGGRKLAQYRLIARRPATVYGQPAVEIDFTWVAPTRDEIQQRQTFVRHGACFLVFTLSARASEFARYESTWGAFMANVQLRV